MRRQQQFPERWNGGAVIFSPPVERASQGRWVAVGAFCMVAAVAYLSRNCLSVFVLDDNFQSQMQASKEELGWAMSSFFLAYAVGQIPAGWLGHRFGSRRMLTVFAAMWSVSTALMGLASGLVMLCLVQAAMGLAQAGVFPNAARSITDWVPVERKALACGLMAACMSVGGAIATGLTGWLAGHDVHWRAIAGMYSIPGLLWAAWFWTWFRDRPEDHPGVNHAERKLIRPDDDGLPARSPPRPPGTRTPASEEPQPSSPALAAGNSVEPAPPEPVPWMRLLTSWPLWLINGQQFFRAAGYVFFATWFPTYLKETRDVTIVNAGLLGSLPLLAVVAGSSLGGGLTDWLLSRTGSRRISRQLTAVVCLTVCGLLNAATVSAATTTAAMTLFVAASFFAAVAGPCGYAQTMDVAGRQVPVVFGMMNMVGNFGAAACAPVVAWYVKADGSGWSIPIHGSWESVPFLFMGIYFAAATCWALLDPSARIEPDRVAPPD